MSKLTCPQCGKTFHVKPSHAPIRTHCSEACMAIAYRTRLRGEGNPNYRGAGYYTCKQCGQQFHSYTKDRVYCSRDCYNVGRQRERYKPLSSAQARAKSRRSQRRVRQRQPKFARLARRPSLNLGLPKTCPTPVRVCTTCSCVYLSRKHRVYCPSCGIRRSPCIICGKRFSVHVAQAKNVTCSVECAAEHKSRRQRGSRSHRWKGGSTKLVTLRRTNRKYQEWRRRVFKRDNYTCQMCSERGGRLTVHHIKKVSTHEHLIYASWNGIALCWSCHGKVNQKESLYEARFLRMTRDKEAPRSLFQH